MSLAPTPEHLNVDDEEARVFPIVLRLMARGVATANDVSPDGFAMADAAPSGILADAATSGALADAATSGILADAATSGIPGAFPLASMSRSVESLAPTPEHLNVDDEEARVFPIVLRLMARGVATANDVSPDGFAMADAAPSGILADAATSGALADAATSGILADAATSGIPGALRLASMSTSVESLTPTPEHLDVNCGAGILKSFRGTEAMMSSCSTLDKL